MFGGRYEGSVTARVGTPLSATLETRIADVDVAQLATFGGVPDTITGPLSGRDVYGLGRGRDAAAAERPRQRDSRDRRRKHQTAASRSTVVLFLAARPGRRRRHRSLRSARRHFSLANRDASRADAVAAVGGCGHGGHRQSESGLTHSTAAPISCCRRSSPPRPEPTSIAIPAKATE